MSHQRPPRTTPVFETLRGWFDEVERTWVGVMDRSPGRPARLSRALGVEHDVACPRCGNSVGPFESDVDGCAACRGKRLAWDRLVRLGSYEGELREAVLKLKYSGWRRVGEDLGRALGEKLASELRKAGRDPSHALVVPVPTVFRRRMARGVDHARILAREVRHTCGCSIWYGLRRRGGQPQTGLSGESRRRNVAGRYFVRGRPRREVGLVVVIDDVRTTGATMQAASRAIRATIPGVSEVWGGVVGVTPAQGSSERS